MPQRPLEARGAVGRQPPGPRPHSPAAAVSIREATVHDVPALIALINAAYKPRDGHVFVGTRTDGEEVAEAFTDTGSRVLVAEVDGVMAACVRLAISDDETWFGLLATDLAYQGRGLAPALIAACEQRAREAGSSTMTIGIIREVGLQPYYESLGYEYASEKPGDELGWSAETHQPFTYVEMKKNL